MSIKHLHYCVEEIAYANRFIQISNNDFYKRAMARLIAIRTDDFIKLGLRLNNATINSPVVRADLGALKALYDDYFKLQRDKFGAHFQQMDLAATLRAWTDIDMQRVDFFSSMSQSYYLHFSAVADYIPLAAPPIDAVLEAHILSVNQEYDIEKFPNLSADILALTRPNSSGLVHSGDLKKKMGTLKAIALIVDYEKAIRKVIPATSTLHEIFTKLLVVDLVSYSDNFYTRTDIATDAPQYEAGLDLKLAAAVPVAQQLVSDFETTYKVRDRISTLRLLRNKVGGHIDPNQTVESLRAMLTGLDFNTYERFYLELKNLYKAVCRSSVTLSLFIAEASDRIGLDYVVTGLPLTSFDGQPIVAPPFIPKRYDSEQELEDSLTSWINTRDNAARDFFYNSFQDGPIVKNIVITEDEGEGRILHGHYKFRKAHQYLEDKLTDATVPYTTKVAIIELFIQCTSGYPAILSDILIRTFPTHVQLLPLYVFGLGATLTYRSPVLLEDAIRLYETGGVIGRRIALLSLFRCDLRSRSNPYGKYEAGDNGYSTFIVRCFAGGMEDVEMALLSLSLSSIYAYDNRIKSPQIYASQIERFTVYFEEALRRICERLGIDTADNEITLAKSQFKSLRYVEVIDVVCTCLKRHGFKEIAERFSAHLLSRHIEFSKTDDNEAAFLVNILANAGRIAHAIGVTSYLMDKHPGNIEYKVSMLKLYLEDPQYKTAFSDLKHALLTDFELEAAKRTQIELLDYNTV